MNGEEGSVYEQESAFDLFVNQNAAWLRLRCGCMDVDDILQGGVLKGELTELVGGIAVGKTQMCLSLTATILMEKDSASSHIIYLDTNGSFRSSRLLQVLVARGNSVENARKLLGRVLIGRVYDANDLKKALIAAEKVGKDIALLIIDSIGAALAETALTYLEGGKEVQEDIISVLHRLARSLGCAIVTTNHLVYWKDCPTPSLGRKWNSAVHSRLLMVKLPESYYIQLIESKRYKLTAQRAYYRIDESGICSMLPNEIAEQTQKTQSIISENWETIMQSCSQIA
uniref:RecA family profile 1 domain-containing protein n=1 Tax=Parascaris univalens TaxID=6257 RepID=A0A915AII9_PARUN